MPGAGHEPGELVPLRGALTDKSVEIHVPVRLKESGKARSRP
jgi:hypothetical protein